MTVLFSSLLQSLKAVQTQASLPLLEASNKVTHYWLFYQICWRCVCVCLFNWPGLASPLLKPLLLKTRCSVIMNPAEGSNRQSPTHIYTCTNTHTHTSKPHAIMILSTIVVNVFVRYTPHFTGEECTTVHFL